LYVVKHADHAREGVAGDSGGAGVIG
jgi:hypothetical protein